MIKVVEDYRHVNERRQVFLKMEEMDKAVGYSGDISIEMFPINYIVNIVYLMTWAVG